MSSHHIVKEDQEPALIIDDFNGIPHDQMGQLLEWSPTVIAHSGNVQRVTAERIKIDVLFADKPVDLFQDQVTSLPLSGPFLDAAVIFLVGKGYRAVNVVSSHIGPDQLLQYAGTINMTLLGNGRRIFVVKSGFSKWKAKGEFISIYGDCMVLETTGLAKQSTGHYVTEANGFYSIRFGGRYGVVGERL